MRTRSFLLAATLTTGLLTALPGTASAAPSGLSGDFNGDGHRDLAIAASIAKVSGKTGAGYVAVVYGTAKGLDTAKRQIISQATAGVPGAPQSSGYFGDRLTTGDLDDDGYTDLIVGAHGRTLGSSGDSGALTVLWGGASGLKTATDITSPLPENRNELGWSVATGDFDGDGDTDLAAANLASPELNVFKGPISRTGKATGLVGIDTYGQTGINTDRIVAGDVTGDGTTDLLVMGQQEIKNGYRTRSVLYKGSASGLKAGAKVAGGYDAVIADVNKDGRGDIVTGNFMEKSTDEPNGGLGGAITITYGSATGLSSRTPVRINQDTAGVPGTATRNDRFGWSLSAGDVNRDGYTDISVGVPQKSVGSAKNAGAVVVLRGSKSGLTGSGAKSFSQNTSGVPGTAESYDFFGAAVRLTDSNLDGFAELVVGAYGENSSDGAVWLLKSGSSGVTGTGAKSFNGKTLGGPSGDAYFGEVLGG
ncbi:integrin alpha [Streptomyces europaeiscabiei]|uniref:FG-GAP repeat protein n=1 Tax=Streptomyces europaeiscabiei TaxID=146819 RepID=UPI0029A7483D|nr:FG-GAP repeat protein [Streptomyces europaeiscabiei]MDX3587711.1 FG-GAP repeat protein [Streptomyces europaeiscabiei]MDX3618973.1 FG-GAP repeat protein [Streptomyces europaeiscabiei]MDX3631816.1 FG-GAP repeat protein [Streptomyces europaeiscabiei]MDX3649597.1 FG-GAP repeat protein [Streptomyces europaeiscabiei]